MSCPSVVAPTRIIRTENPSSESVNCNDVWLMPTVQLPDTLVRELVPTPDSPYTALQSGKLMAGLSRLSGGCQSSLNGIALFHRSRLPRHPWQPFMLVPATRSTARATGCATMATRSPSPVILRLLRLNRLRSGSIMAADQGSRIAIRGLWVFVRVLSTASKSQAS